MQDRTTWTLRPGYLVANAATAFCLNLAVFLLIGKTSALTMNIAGVIKDWLLIWMSMKMFTAPVTGARRRLVRERVAAPLARVWASLPNPSVRVQR